MSLIVDINNKAASLSSEQQREALDVIEKLAAQREAQIKATDRRNERPPLKGATAQPGKRSITAEEIQAARREMWKDFYDKEE